MRVSMDPSLNPIAEEMGPIRTNMKPNAPSLLSHANIKQCLNQGNLKRNVVSAHHRRPRNTNIPRNDSETLPITTTGTRLKSSKIRAAKQRFKYGDQRGPGEMHRVLSFDNYSPTNYNNGPQTLSNYEQILRMNSTLPSSQANRGVAGIPKPFR